MCIITTMLEVRPATQEDVSAIAQVLSEAAVYKAEQGDYLWGTEPFTSDEIEARLQGGGLYAAISDGEVVGTVTLTDQDKRIWEDDGENHEALYIHQLATSDEARGKNLGEQIIDWAVDKAREEGRNAVRLDCSYTNRGLCQYYERRGFAEVKRRDIPRKTAARDLRDTVYQVALLQRDV